MPRRQTFEVEREVRLRPAFAQVYPSLLAGVWLPAWSVAEQLLEGQGKAAEGSTRVCDPHHFDFRGGRGRPPELRSVRTRTTDPGPSGRPGTVALP